MPSLASPGDAHVNGVVKSFVFTNAYNICFVYLQYICERDFSEIYVKYI